MTGKSSTLTADEKRKLWRAYWRAYDRACAEQEAAHEAAREAWHQAPPGTPPPEKARPQLLPFPRELVDMTCGATTRAGTPCKRRDLYGNGRCPLHGGLSTGPVTSEGKEQARINGRKGGRPKKPKPMRG